MSVLADISLFPLDKGASVSPYVTRAVRLIRDSGLPFVLGPMGTCVEGELEDILALVRDCHAVLAQDCERVYLTVKLDSRRGPTGRLAAKVAAVRDKL